MTRSEVFAQLWCNSEYKKLHAQKDYLFAHMRHTNDPDYLRDANQECGRIIDQICDMEDAALEDAGHTS